MKIALKITEAIFELIILIVVIDMNFRLPCDYLFFIFDALFIILFVLYVFLPEKYLKLPFFEEQRFSIFKLRVITVMGMLIIWQQWDFVTEKLPFLKDIF